MQDIYVECEYTLSKIREKSEADGNYIFQKSSENLSIKVDISYSRGSAIAKVLGAKLSTDHIEELSKLKRFDGEKLSSSCDKAIHSISRKASNFTRKILKTIKYHLDHDDFNETLFAIKSEKWGTTKDILKYIPTTLSVVISDGSTYPLSQDSYKRVKKSLHAGIEPLMAMRHLHRARHESSPHHKWIDATIAAELAIKEVLSRAKPDLELLLLEVPSPPISKLYGKIMKKYLGVKSPYRGSLIKGMEVRNTLVHRHDDTTIDGQKAVDYVKEVERAIFHLLTLLYPNDSLIKYTYALKK